MTNGRGHHVGRASAALEPGASVSAIAREAGVHPSQLWGWRRQLRATAPTSFTPVRVAEEPLPIAALGSAGTIEIELSGARLRITGAVAPSTLTAVLAVQASGRR
jgi:transposase